MGTEQSPIAAWIAGAQAVFLKDWRSELRTRYALSALVMFVLTTISIVMFALAGEDPPVEIMAGVFWIIIIFSGMSGLSRTFVSEEERGTALTLLLTTPASCVFAGKLLFNVALVLGVDVLAVSLFFPLIGGLEIRTVSMFVLTLILGSIGLAVASTIIAAIIAKANSKGTLFPVLAFPLLVPLLITVVSSTRMAAEGALLDEAGDEFRVLVAYIGAVATISFLVFDYVWKD